MRSLIRSLYSTFFATSTRYAGIIAIAVVAVVLHVLVSMAAGCKPVPVPVQDVIECSKLEFPKLEAEGKALLDLALSQGWSAAEGQAEKDILSSGADIVGCAFAMITQQYLLQHKQSGDTAPTWAANDALTKLRAKISPPGKSVGFKFDSPAAPNGYEVY